MFNSKKITYAFVIILLLASVSLALFALTRPFFTQQNKYVVVPAFEGQANYITAAQADPSADLDALYQQYVTDVYKGSCVGGGMVNTNPYGSVVAGHPLGNLDELAQGVQTLRASDIVQIAKTALQKSFEMLPGSKITVCIFALDPIQQSWVELNMNGVYGETDSPTQILIEVAPRGDWQDWIPDAIAHEYHHALVFQMCQPECSIPNLLDVLISEGRAESFAHLLYPKMEAPWTKALTPEQEATQWQGMQDYLTSTSHDIGRFLFGNTNQIPMWAGYTIGFHIVQKYIQVHPNASPMDWSKLDAHELLVESGYNGQP